MTWTSAKVTKIPRHFNNFEYRVSKEYHIQPFFKELQRCIYMFCHFSIAFFNINQHWDGTGSWNPSSSMMGAHSISVVNTMIVDDTRSQCINNQDIDPFHMEYPSLGTKMVKILSFPLVSVYAISCVFVYTGAYASGTFGNDTIVFYNVVHSIRTPPVDSMGRPSVCTGRLWGWRSLHRRLLWIWTLPYTRDGTRGKTLPIYTYGSTYQHG